MSPLEKNLVVSCKRQYLSECASSDFSSCGTYIMGYTSKGQFSLFKMDGTKLIEATYADIANCFFSKYNKFVVVTHGSGKETKVTMHKIATKEVAAALTSPTPSTSAS